MSGVFEGTGVKRYALRYRNTRAEAWQYPPELQYDTVEEAQAALAALPLSGGYQVVEKHPFLSYKPIVAGGVTHSPLRDNVLAACGRKPYIVQGKECDAPAPGARVAVLGVRYEPVEGGA